MYAFVVLLRFFHADRTEAIGLRDEILARTGNTLESKELGRVQGEL
ncbi:MAG: hypothetical protein LBD79_00755 [Treponema sp.]|jgi:hypothetical protein|nr:hypothetical protein [Treponema sp.]